MAVDAGALADPRSTTRADMSISWGISEVGPICLVARHNPSDRTTKPFSGPNHEQSLRGSRTGFAEVDSGSALVC